MPDRALHRLVSGFVDVADNYELGRPEYPAEFVPTVMAQAGLTPGARVLDLAAGTGKLTRALLAAGLDVVAVEPLAGMRERLVGNLPAGQALDGTAEAIPLPAASVDAVFCGDAFHWFDGPAAVAEIARILLPGGALVLSWLVPDAPGPDGWPVRVDRVLAHARPEHPAFTADRGMAALDAHTAFTPRRALPVAFVHETGVEGLRAYVASFSYIGALEPDVRGALLEEVTAAVAAEPLPLRAPYRADAWLTTRRV